MRYSLNDQILDLFSRDHQFESHKLYSQHTFILLLILKSMKLIDVYTS